MQYEIGVLGSAVIAGALRDPYLVGIHVSGGDLIENTTDDNSGGGTNPGVLFEAPFGGIYYIAVRSADGGTGTYRVDVSRRIGTTITRPTPAPRGRSRWADSQRGESRPRVPTR